MDYNTSAQINNSVKKGLYGAFGLLRAMNKQTMGVAIPNSDGFESQQFAGWQL
jgi:hypothetical protein